MYRAHFSQKSRKCFIHKLIFWIQEEKGIYHLTHRNRRSVEKKGNDHAIYSFSVCFLSSYLYDPRRSIGNQAAKNVAPYQILIFFDNVNREKQETYQLCIAYRDSAVNYSADTFILMNVCDAKFLFLLRISMCGYSGKYKEKLCAELYRIRMIEYGLTFHNNWSSFAKKKANDVAMAAIFSLLTLDTRIDDFAIANLPYMNNQLGGGPI